VPVSFPWIVFAWFVTLGAATVHGTVGMGLGLMSVPVLALVAPELVPVPQLLMALALNVAIFVREREHLDRRGLLWVILGRFPGAALGAWLLTVFDQQALILSIGIIVLVSVLVAAWGARVPRTPPVAFTAGAFAAVGNLVAASGGPMIALLYKDEPGPTVRATLGAIFTIGITINLVARGIAGEVSWVDARVALILAPAVALGLWISRHLTPRVEGARMRALILWVSGLASAGLIIKALLT
jgi:uncharacterized membrane protein YfcA